MSKVLNRVAILFLLLLLFLTACSPSQATATALEGSPAALIPYQSATPLPPATSPVDIDLDRPTPTPATYTVVSGDTLIGIATRFGISLDALKVANPGVEPSLLTPGTTLFLPSGNGTAQAGIPTPTPVGVTLGGTNCYASAAGELWCFVIVQNPLDADVENLIGVVQLLSANGAVLATLEAIPPINLLESGKTMPLVAYSSQALIGWTTARGQLISAYSLSEETDYYLTAQIQDANIQISTDGLSAKVTGRVEVQNGEPGTIWVLAIAYDAAGDVIGFRRWESEGQLEFETYVYSLVGKIDSVDLLVEARR